MIHRTAMDLKMPWMANHGGISNMHPEKAHKIVLIFYISVNFGFINRTHLLGKCTIFGRSNVIFIMFSIKLCSFL